MIIAHVKDGVELAKRYKLPMPVIDIISQHHGKTLVSFFYHKSGEEKEKTEKRRRRAEFRYPGPNPSPKEAALVMMADSCEAAVRSLSDNSPSVVRNLIHKIIWDKVMDGQLSECSLTLKRSGSDRRGVLPGVVWNAPSEDRVSCGLRSEGRGDGRRYRREIGIGERKKREDNGKLEGEDDN